MNLKSLILPIVTAGIGLFGGWKFRLETDLPTAARNLAVGLDKLDPLGTKKLVDLLEESRAKNTKFEGDILRLSKALSPFTRVKPAMASRLTPTDKWVYHAFYVSGEKGQQGIHEMQEALNNAHVAPGGVKTLWGIGTYPPHDASVMLWIRQGDEAPIKYTYTALPNSGDATLNAANIAEKLKDREIMPLGWGFESKYYAFLSAEWDVKKTP